MHAHPRKMAFAAIAALGSVVWIAVTQTNVARTIARDGESSYVALVPARLMDSRVDGVTIDGLFARTGLLVGGSTVALGVAGRGGVLANASTAVMNVTVTDAAGAGFVTMYPCDAPKPLASNLNYSPGQTIPNAVIVKLSAAGTVCAYSSNTVNLIVDANGYDINDSTITIPAPHPAVIQAVYAVPSDGIEVAGRTTAIASEITAMQTWYDSQTGGLHPLFVRAADTISVVTVRLSESKSAVRNDPNAVSTVNSSLRLAKPQFTSDVRLAVFYEGDSGSACGITYRMGPISFFPIGNCAPTTYLVTHEITHLLGAVPACAPHATPGGGHVIDDNRDILYQGPLGRDWGHLMLDPGHDDYFRTGNGCFDIANSPLLGNG